MAVLESRIHWNRKRVFYPVVGFTGWVNSSGDEVSATDAAVVRAEIGSTGIMAAAWTATTHATLAVRTLVPFPADLNDKYPMGFRVYWSADASGTFVPTVTWDLKVDYYARTKPLPSAAGLVALDTPLVSDTAEGDTTDDCLSVTERGLKTLAIWPWTYGLAESCQLMQLSLSPTTFNTLTALYAIGVEIDYAPMLMAGNDSYISEPGYTRGTLEG